MTKSQQRQLRKLGLKGEERAAKGREIVTEAKRKREERKANKELDRRIAKTEASLNQKLTAFKPRIFEKAIASIEKTLVEQGEKIAPEDRKKVSNVVSMAERRARKAKDKVIEGLKAQAAKDISSVRSKVTSIQQAPSRRKQRQELDDEITSSQQKFEKGLADLAQSITGKGPSSFSKAIADLDKELSGLEDIVAKMTRRKDGEAYEYGELDRRIDVITAKLEAL